MGWIVLARARFLGVRWRERKKGYRVQDWISSSSHQDYQVAPALLLLLLLLLFFTNNPANTGDSTPTVDEEGSDVLIIGKVPPVISPEALGTLVRLALVCMRSSPDFITTSSISCSKFNPVDPSPSPCA